jgi:DNA repair protein RadC
MPKVKEKFSCRLELQLVRDDSVGFIEEYSGSQDVADSFKWLTNKPQEEVWAVYMTTMNRVIGYRMVSRGSDRQSFCEPADFLKPALLCSAAKVALIHNHPSDDPIPSDDDILTTERSKLACDIMGIEFLDHIVVSASGFVSIRAMEPKIWGEEGELDDGE